MAPTAILPRLGLVYMCPALTTRFPGRAGYGLLCLIPVLHWGVSNIMPPLLPTNQQVVNWLRKPVPHRERRSPQPERVSRTSSPASPVRPQTPAPHY